MCGLPRAFSRTTPAQFVYIWYDMITFIVGLICLIVAWSVGLLSKFINYLKDLANYAFESRRNKWTKEQRKQFEKENLSLGHYVSLIVLIILVFMILGQVFDIKSPSTPYSKAEQVALKFETKIYRGLDKVFNLAESRVQRDKDYPNWASFKKSLQITNKQIRNARYWRDVRKEIIQERHNADSLNLVPQKGMENNQEK